MESTSEKACSQLDWQQKARDLTLETRLFIGGEYRDSIDGNRLDLTNPATGKAFTTVSAGNDKDINNAVSCALRAHKNGVWRKLKPRDRAAVLYRFADLIDAHADTLALLDTLCMGKPIAQAREWDIPDSAMTLRYFAECIDKMEGKVTTPYHDALHYVLREPLGVVGAISPWNYPVLMAMWKFAPALAAGNTVVLKPAEQAPLSCLYLGQLFMDAGGPADVFNIVSGLGPDAGKPLALHNDVAKISFTGSSVVGKQILIYAGQSNMKRVGLECGGKSPQLFLDDLPDIDTAVNAAVDGIFSNAGQVCNAGSRLLVEKTIYDDFVNRFVEKTQQAYRIGDPLQWETTMGPLVTHSDKTRVLSMLQQAKNDGSTIAIGGDASAEWESGAFINPTLVTHVNRDTQMAKEEVFGPVAAALSVDSINDGVQLANDSIYGLAASVWTKDISRAHKAARDIEAGVVWINTYFEEDMSQPFGGYKQSGNARDKCFESLIEYTQMKSVWVSL